MHSSEMAKLSEGPYVPLTVEELCTLTIQEMRTWANEGYRQCEINIQHSEVVKYLQDKDYQVMNLFGSRYQVSW
jgi:hypothetical protein